MSYKLIASDVDGTLVGDDSIVSRENLDAIKKIADKGTYFAIASGRSFLELPDALRACPSIRYYITSNGACIYDKVRDEDLLFPLSGEKIAEILAVTEDYKVCYSAHREKAAHFDHRLSEDDMIYYFIEEGYRRVFQTQTEHLENVFEFTKDDKTEMFVAFFHDMDERRACLERLKKIDGISVTGSIPYNAEIISSEATKGNALTRLRRLLSIEKSECIAVGDSPNDLTLLSAAGLPLAVANALDALKEKAASVICHQNEHIAKYILENYIG